jgi:prolyl-tRNA editing enzyme YbaK/EbsC (Cys-tRNA(Pro) deacylase)
VTELHPNCIRINELLGSAGVPGRVRILSEAAPTALAAAEQIGCDVGAIANSLLFSTAEDQPLLVLTSGAHRVDTTFVADHVGTSSLRRASPGFVRAHTGQVIGGVSPIGHPTPIRTLIDVALADYPTIWAAGGIAHAIFPITYPELQRITGAEQVAVA